MRASGGLLHRHGQCNTREYAARCRLYGTAMSAKARPCHGNFMLDEHLCEPCGVAEADAHKV